MVHFNESGKKVTAPKVNRNFVPPGMLARGRGKSLKDLYTSHEKNSPCVTGDAGIRRPIGSLVNKQLTVSGQHPRQNSGHHLERNYGQPSGQNLVRDSPVFESDARAAFDPFLTSLLTYGCMGTSAHNMRERASSKSFREYANIDDDNDNDFCHDIEPHNDISVREQTDLFCDDHSRFANDFVEEEPYGEMELSHQNREMEHLEENDAAGEREQNDEDDEMEQRIGEMEQSAEQEDAATNGGPSKKRKTGNGKPRGRNKCKEIAKLKPGQKLEVAFYNNRAVGDNQKIFARHLGIIVRDTNICPLRVRKWRDIGEAELDHMWRAVTDVFTNENMDDYRNHVLKHMNELWNNWRADLLRYNVKEPKLTLQAALKKVPNGLDKDEWKWLIKEVYSTDSFKKASAKNSENRSNFAKELLHRTGSRPYRQVIWDELGGNKGKKPSFLEIYRETHKKSDKLVNVETSKKYDEIRETIQKEPSLTHEQVAQKVFKSKSRDRVVGLGGGMTHKDIRGPQPTRMELQSQLIATKKQNEDLSSRVGVQAAENQELRNRLGTVKSQIELFKGMLMDRFNVPNQSHECCSGP